MPVPPFGSTPLSAATLPVWASPAERLRLLLGYAVLAPSRHNVQPWIFEIEGEEARLYADFRRALHVSDPRDREMVIACGAALLNLRVAAAHFGYATSAEVLAAGARQRHLARVRSARTRLLALLKCLLRRAPPEAVTSSSVLLIMVAHAETLRSCAAGCRSYRHPPVSSARAHQERVPSAGSQA